MTISWISLPVKKNTLIKFTKSLLTLTACPKKRKDIWNQPVGTRTGIIYGFCKVHKKCVDDCPPFRPILSSLQTPTFKLAKYLELLTTNKYTVKDLFNFANEIVKQDSSNFMGSLDIDSFFTNITFKETIEICTNNLFKNNNIVHGLKKKWI